ncbi:MAG: PAS domain-containing protein [Phycisphaerae bacterium]|nr:PAS domain-containing protein [Phycisphaerae bacterium]
MSKHSESGEGTLATRPSAGAAEMPLASLERRLFVGGPVAVFRWVAVPGWPVEYVSPNIAGIFGHTADDFLTGRVSYASVVYPEDLSRVAAEVAAFSASGVPYFEQDYRIVRADGEVRWLYDFTAVVRNERGDITHYEGYVLDITERRRAESERRELEVRMHQTQKLESLGVLAGGIAHDFNNLLVGVLGNAELALAETREGSSLHDAVVRIRAAAQRAAELAQQMLAYTGRAEARAERIDVGALVRETVSLLGVSLSARAKVRCRVEPGLPEVLGDAVQIRRVVMNLLTNASDALGESEGSIEATASAMTLGRGEISTFQVGQAIEPGLYVAVDVRDDGCGMSDETVARMFDPFFTTKFVGRGLGLASALGIVRAHRGAIRVRSTPGKGTWIRVLLPCASEPSAPTSRSPIPQADVAPLDGVRLLVVDDEPMVRDVVVRFALSLGCTARGAADGDEAIAVLAAAPDAIDCVLIDATMPGRSGIETLAALRELRPGLPAIVMSGFVDADPTAAAAGRGGGDREPIGGFLQKPFSPDDLASALRVALSTQRAAAES